MDAKPNCWEVLGCGREPGGTRAVLKGVCPAAVDQEFAGVNGGQAAGRFCWTVAGTFCRGVPQGCTIEYVKDCILCPFLDQVADEEGERFALTRADLQQQRLERIRKLGR